MDKEIEDDYKLVFEVYTSLGSFGYEVDEELYETLIDLYIEFCTLVDLDINETHGANHKCLKDFSEATKSDIESLVYSIRELCSKLLKAYEIEYTKGDVICNGSKALGNNCGHCRRCEFNEFKDTLRG